MAKRSEALTYVNKTHPITITKDEKWSDHRRIEGMHLIIFKPTFLLRILVYDILYTVQIRVMTMQSEVRNFVIEGCDLSVSHLTTHTTQYGHSQSEKSKDLVTNTTAASKYIHT